VAAYSIADLILLPELHKALDSELSNETVRAMDGYCEKRILKKFQDGYRATGRDEAPNPFWVLSAYGDYFC
jgi:hypothetical protein